jgi:hypothetical protein
MAEATTKRLERRVALLKARSAVAVCMDTLKVKQQVPATCHSSSGLGVCYPLLVQHLTRTIAEVKAAAGREREKLQGYEAEASRLQHMM